MVRQYIDPDKHWKKGAYRFNLRDITRKCKNIKLNSRVIPEIKEQLISIVKKYWDCFCKEGTKRTILVYKFSVDTGHAKPVCCRKPKYVPYESNNIMEQVKDLINNVWIEKCEGPWGISIVLSTKPHQEHIQNIDDFIWGVCVSYRKRNGITKPFDFPILRCDESISTGGSRSNKIWIISLDARQGYHQISVRHIYREN